MNLKQWYEIIVVVTELVLFLCIMSSFRKKGNIARFLRGILLLAMIGIIFNGLGVIAENHFLSLAWQSMFALSIDWMLLLFLAYTREFTDTEFIFRPLMVVFTILAVADSVSLLLNPRFRHVFALPSSVVYADTTVYPLDTGSVFYICHLAICYLISLNIIVLLIQKIAGASSFYRKKYSLIFVFFIIALLGDAFNLIIATPFNFSIFFYGIVAVFVAHCSLFYIPRSLVGNMLNLVVKDLNKLVICYDSDGKVIYANQVATEAVAFAKKTDLMTQKFRDWKVTYGDSEDERATWMETMTVEGETRHFECETQKLFDDNKKFIGVYFLISNRTEEMERHAAEVKKAQEAAEKQSRFWADISHEMRTPVNAILGMNEMILRESENATIRGYADVIRHSTEAITALINDVLDFSKINAKHMPIVPNEYSVLALVKNVYLMMQPKAVEKGLEFEIEVDPYLPKILLGDELRIQQIMVNLISNAIKYTEEGSVTVRVYGERRFSEFFLHVEVEDTGRGIKQEDISLLFEIYNRVDESKNHGIQGTGLGINICEQLLELMDSKLEVSSEFNKGSIFAFSVNQPAMDSDFVGDFDEYMSSYKTEKRKFSFTEKMKVLMVDDNDISRDVFRILLKRTAVEVTTAASGTEALEACATDEFDIIFLDHLMPEMNGDEVLTLIREQEGGLNTNTPAILMTGNVADDLRQNYQSYGFCDLLLKPVEPAVLEDALVKWKK